MVGRFKQVGIAAISAGVGGGGGTGNIFTDFAVGAATNALVQGISVATGLQKKFDWAGVAAAGIGAGAGQLAGQAAAGAGAGATVARAAAISASTIANAATRSAITGSNFGDNLARALPSAIGQFIGQEFASAAANGFGKRSEGGGKGSAEQAKQSGDAAAGADNGSQAAGSVVQTGQDAEIVVTANTRRAASHISILNGQHVAYIDKPDGQWVADMDNRKGVKKLSRGTYSAQDAKEDVDLTIQTLRYRRAGKPEWLDTAELEISKAQVRGDPRGEDAYRLFLRDIKRGTYDKYMFSGAQRVASAPVETIVVSAPISRSRSSTLGPVEIASVGGGSIAATQDASSLASSGADFFSGVFAGDASSSNSTAAEVGKAIGGFLPFADVRDIGIAAYGVFQGEKGAWGNLGIAAIGAVPVLGDIGKQVLRHGDEVLDAANRIATSGSQLRAIAAGAADLSPKQASVLAQLDGFGSRAVISKRGFGQSDLAALSASTGDEFAMFTTGGRRLLIRGDANSVPISLADGSAQSLAGKGWRWSSHVHPDGSLLSSEGDRAVLSAFGNSRSAILSPTGSRGLFNANGDLIGSGWLPGGR